MLQGFVSSARRGLAGLLAGVAMAVAGSALAGPATQIAVHSGAGQTAVVGTAVATPPSVLVRDAGNQPVAGVTVSFRVFGLFACRPVPGFDVCTGSGTGLTATTNANGIATIGSWVLAFQPGVNSLEATVAGLTGSPVLFTATGVAGAAREVAIHAGNGQAAAPGAPVATAPSVVVRDANLNGVAGVAVAFVPTAPGNGAVAHTVTTTDANGVATAGTWTLGPALGSQTLAAMAAGVGGPVIFTATAAVGSAPPRLAVEPVPGLQGPALGLLSTLLLAVAARRGRGRSGKSLRR